MPWNADLQRRFDELRRAELNEMLSEDEQAELAVLVNALEQDEARVLGPVVAQMQAEQRLLQSQLEAVQGENTELARLLSQQQQLVADARRWLAQFEQRHRAIQLSYTRLTGEVLAAPQRP